MRAATTEPLACARVSQENAVTFAYAIGEDMNRRTGKVLDWLEAQQPLADFYRAGFSPDDARVAAERLVAPYVEDRARLPEIPMEVLFPYAREVATAIRYGKEPVLIGAQRIYRATYRRTPAECLRLFIQEENALSEAGSIFWRLFHLERDRAELEFEEFVHETLSVLGTLLEGLMKPRILALSAQVELGAGIPSASNKTFGKALDIVATEFPDDRVFELSGVRVNQWRNIAQHLSYVVDAEFAVCRYGSDDQHTVRLSRAQLNGVLMGASHIARALKVARELFFLDRFEELRREGFESQLGRERQEACLAVIAGGLASQGFALADASIDSSWSNIVVQEMSDLPPEERAAHASQALFPLAEFCPAPMLSVTYRERDGTSALLVIAPLEVVERARESGNLAAALSEMTFVNLKQQQVARAEP